MFLRCEYVDEFAPVLLEINKPGLDCLAKLNELYRSADAKSMLRPGVSPENLAHDTLIFVIGLFHRWLAAEPGNDLRRRTPAMIRDHVALRRR